MLIMFYKIVIYLIILMIFRRLKSYVVIIVVVKIVCFVFWKYEKIFFIVYVFNDVYRSWIIFYVDFK